MRRQGMRKLKCGVNGLEKLGGAVASARWRCCVLWVVMDRRRGVGGICSSGVQCRRDSV
jgi:hypothetical protein